MKNVCQTCLLDLQYGLSTQFRDAAFGKGSDSGPSDNLNKAYIAQNAEGHLENVTASSFGKSDPAVKEILKKMARQDPNYNRARPKPYVPVSPLLRVVVQKTLICHALLADKRCNSRNLDHQV